MILNEFFFYGNHEIKRYEIQNLLNDLCLLNNSTDKISQYQLKSITCDESSKQEICIL